ncbi:MAG: hypothetical protein OHK0029_41140 [Armatimonadaceae bacterium]
MARVLPLVSSSADEAAWQVFLRRRQELTNRMEMATCDGCDGCGMRCTAGFGVTEVEWRAIQEYLRIQAPEEVQRVRHQQKTVPWVGAEDTGATVTYCRFRDMERGNCSIYPVRPTICRLFGHTRWLPCPIEAISHYPDGAEAVWENYRRFPRQTFEEWEQSVLEPLCPER